ncbi:efflux RND transporter periplasmic adaptor subunit [Undibacterium sp. Jales W-56]|uniref:efflux RND transporter periplasmic adaptor subunit n=1 Tax=Undibacterium sp. Jales W-56 TaxID=2897325 RepID=UPI0021CFE670|nr:efflux RND transporter periplasmic adaptor subunit [Undibacterium sp. Jales W-56]MCU6435483.1 efflux RND transporter periplasmic adaptor subunit [Undibacterium sp. Jales W-56]
MKINKSYLIGLAILALIGVVTYTSGLVKATEKKPESPANHKSELGKISYPANAPQLGAIKVAAIQEVNLPVSEAMNGKLVYDENVTARVSSPILGRVVSSKVEVGDVVEKNKSLVVLDSPDLATAETDLAKAKADEHRKKLAFERSKKLYEHEVIAAKDLESSEADYAQAAAEARRSSLRLRNLNAVGNDNGNFALKAPISGTITDKQINPGMEVRPDAPNPLFVISDISRLWVVIDVPERYMGGIKPGQKLGLEFDAYPEQIFEARVDRIGLALDPGTRRIQVRGRLSNNDLKLRPEMFARVNFFTDGDKKALQIPNAALITEGLYSYIFIEKRQGEFQKLKVNIIRKGRDASYADIAGNTDLSKGQRIVTAGALLLNSEAASHAQ